MKKHIVCHVRVVERSRLLDQPVARLPKGLLKFMAPGPFVPFSFLHRINTSGVKVRPVLKTSKIFIS